jgi:hypothetical protein
LRHLQHQKQLQSSSVAFSSSLLSFYCWQLAPLDPSPLIQASPPSQSNEVQGREAAATAVATPAHQHRHITHQLQPRENLLSLFYNGTQ